MGLFIRKSSIDPYNLGGVIGRNESRDLVTRM